MKSPSKPAPVQEPKVIRKRTAKAAPKTQGNFVRETGNHGRYTQEQEGFEMKNIANEVQDINVQNQEIREQESFEMVQVVLLVAVRSPYIPILSWTKQKLKGGVSTVYHHLLPEVLYHCL